MEQLHSPSHVQLYFDLLPKEVFRQVVDIIRIGENADRLQYYTSKCDKMSATIQKVERNDWYSTYFMTSGSVCLVLLNEYHSPIPNIRSIKGYDILLVFGTLLLSGSLLLTLGLSLTQSYYNWQLKRCKIRV